MHTEVGWGISEEKRWEEENTGKFTYMNHEGRAIAHAVSRWLPTSAARVRSRVWSSGTCGGQSGALAGFL
jgi:hypothetical protein